MSPHPRRFLPMPCLLLALGLLVAGNAQADDDPPARVARLAYLAGNVTFAPAGEDQWGQASINRPMTTGDRLLTDDASRAAMDIDGGDLRIDSNTGFNFLRLDDSGTQIELSRGTLNWRIDTIREGQNNEVDTPTLAFVATQPGTYKIEVSADGGATTISILQDGAGTVYGEGGASYPLSGRQSWTFSDSALRDISGAPLAMPDDFDAWCVNRDAQARGAGGNDYVSTDVVGYADLAYNGNWDSDADYGDVWYPATVVAGWAPYRYGHWAWIAPWGWTWIDDAPWGFAPFHYGRWIYRHERWGWVPGPRQVRPVYCPAMVAFVGGGDWHVSVSSGRPVAWVPLGPRDVYVPWYRGSQRYVTNVNVSNVVHIDRRHITTVYNDYHGPRRDQIRYMNQSVPGAATAVDRDVFGNGHRVNRQQLAVSPAQLQNATATGGQDLPAGHPGGGLRVSADPRLPSQEFDRAPVLHRSPPQTGWPHARTPATAPGWAGGQRRTQTAPANGIDFGRPAASPRNETPSPSDAGFANHPSSAPAEPRSDEDHGRAQNQATQAPDRTQPDSMPSSDFTPWNRRTGRTPSANPERAPVQQSPNQAPYGQADGNRSAAQPTAPQTSPQTQRPRPWLGGSPRPSPRENPLEPATSAPSAPQAPEAPQRQWPQGGAHRQPERQAPPMERRRGEPHGGFQPMRPTHPFPQHRPMPGERAR